MSTTREFAFRALDGSGLLGYLAALGLMSILEAEDPGIRAKWVTSEASPYPTLEVPGEMKRADLVERLYAARGCWERKLASLPDKMRETFASLGFDAETYREFAQYSLTDESTKALAGFAGTEQARLSRKGERRFARSPFYFFSGQQDLTGTILEIASNVSRNDLEKLFDCWPAEIPLRRTRCLRFEPQEVEDHALRMMDPSGDASPKNVTANFLASLALPLLYSWPSEWGSEALNNRSSGDGDRQLGWRLWDEWLSLKAALSVQRVTLGKPISQGLAFSAKAVLAVRGQTYYRMLPSRQEG